VSQPSEPERDCRSAERWSYWGQGTEDMHMAGTKDRQRWRSHGAAEVSSGGGEAWRSQWRHRCVQVGGADPYPEAAVESVPPTALSLPRGSTS
jgi:hypothetical protein